MLIIDNQFPTLCSRASCDYSETREKLFSTRDKLFEYRSFPFNCSGENDCKAAWRNPCIPFLPIERSREGKKGCSTPDRSSASATTTTAPVVCTWVNGPLSLGAKSGLFPPLPLLSTLPSLSLLFSSFPCHSFLFFFLSFFLRQTDNNASMKKERRFVIDIT